METPILRGMISILTEPGKASCLIESLRTGYLGMGEMFDAFKEWNNDKV